MTHSLAIFDFDGTLADSWPWFLRQLDQVADRFGIRRPAPEEIETLRRLSSREILASLNVSIWKLPQIAAHFRSAALADADGIALFPGIDTMLRALKAHGIRLGIASSNDEQVIRRVLGDELAALIDDFECGASMFGKGHRLTRLLKTLHVPQEQAVLIGDETRDADAAKSAGIAAAAVSWGYAGAEAFQHAELVARFTTPQDITTFFTAGAAR